MKKISAYEIALSALSCALATLILTVGVYSAVLLFTGYLVAAIALMLPLAKKSYTGYALAYVATCILTLIFNVATFFDVLPFIMFFGLHPLVNEWLFHKKFNRVIATVLKAIWFDVTAYVIWLSMFRMTVAIPEIEQYIIPIILVLGTAFFLFYDYVMYKWRLIINVLVKRITRK